jgi:proteasome accessory factor A
MAIKRVMGTETEYGIVGGSPSQVLDNYQGKGKTHENKSPTNQSAVAGMVDRGHFGGDYVGQEMDEGLAIDLGLTPGNVSRRYGYGGTIQGSIGFTQYFGRDDMLANGARFYIDMGHPEYSTPECSNPVSAVIADKAGERILEMASEGGKVARIFKNNTDGFNSYGAHENYFVDRKKVKQFKRLADFMTPFFVSRLIFTGSGKIGFVDERSMQLQKTMQGVLDGYASLQNLSVGKMEDLYQRVKDGLEEVIGGMREDEFIFHLSQRADFFTQLMSLQTTYDRPIINTRDEPLSDRSKYMRFHVINGDANMSEVATYMKLGTAALALDLFEDKKMKTLRLEDAVGAFHDISRDPELQTRVKVKKKGEMTAIEMQRAFYEAAESAYRGRDDMTDDILDRWQFTLNALGTDPSQLNRQVDWLIKKNLIDSYKARTGKRLSDTAVRNIDLQYHEINRQKGLFFMLQSKGMVDRLVTDEQIDHAVENPPEDTRAYLRGELIRRNNVSNSDWDKVSLSGQRDDIVLPDPFMGTKAQVGYLFDGQDLSDKEMVEELRKKGYVEERKYFGFSNKTQGGKTHGTTTRPTISKVRSKGLPRKKGNK